MTFSIFDFIFFWLFSAVFIFIRSNWENSRAMKVSKICCFLFSAFKERSRDLIISDFAIDKKESEWDEAILSNLKIFIYVINLVINCVKINLIDESFIFNANVYLSTINILHWTIVSEFDDCMKD
jgi:hypothetical protein